MKSELQSRLPREPSQFNRVIWFYGGISIGILLAPPSSILSPTWWKTQALEDVLAVALAAGIGLVLGALYGREIWQLKLRNSPTWKVVATVLSTLGVMGTLIGLRELDVWRWTFAQSDALLGTWTLTMSAVAGITESRKGVRVYLGRKGYEFYVPDRDA